MTTFGKNVEINWPQIPLFVPEKAIAVIEQLARDHVDLATELLAGYVADAAPRNLGTLAQSFQASPATDKGGRTIFGHVVNDGEILGRVYSTLPQAIVMEEGRRAGFPVSRAGVAGIALWVRRKLGLSGREAMRATYAIAWKIRTRGILGVHYARTGFGRAEPRIDSLFEAFGRDLAAGLTGER